MQTGPSLEPGRSFGKWLLARRAGRSVVLCDVYDYHADEPGPANPAVAAATSSATYAASH